MNSVGNVLIDFNLLMFSVFCFVFAVDNVQDLMIDVPPLNHSLIRQKMIAAEFSEFALRRQVLQRAVIAVPDIEIG